MKYEQSPLSQILHKQEEPTCFKCPMPIKTIFFSSNTHLLMGYNHDLLYSLFTALCPPH